MILCCVSDIAEGEAKGLYLEGGESVFAVKKGGEIFVYRNQCPHLGIPLEMMPDKFLDLDKEYIQCSTHGALFQIEDGFCVAGPCSGASLVKQDFEILGDEIHLKL